jgi:4-hydroxy-2-oxoheptanedioate aldolase
MGTEQFNARRMTKQRPLLGLSLCTFDPHFVDIAARFGFDFVWIEMEHACITSREAELLCRMINGNQMLSLIRLPNNDRDIVLKAAEAGADMLMLPMVNGAADLTRFVKHAKYAPIGERGFHKFSRSMNYGVGNTINELRRQANENLMLWGQVETLAAISNLDELCKVVGIDGFFAGPGDLSSAFGIPGNITDKQVIDAATAIVETCLAHDKRSGYVANPADIPRWVARGIDMLVVGNNIGFYIGAAEKLRRELDQVFKL